MAVASTSLCFYIAMNEHSLRMAGAGGEATNMMQRLQNSSEISFVIQGPLFRKTAARDDLTLRALESIRRFFPDAEIIVSTWEGQDTSRLPADKFIFSVDPGPLKDANGEAVNINRQILSTQVGLRAATRPYAVKFRADFVLADPRFFAESLRPATGPDAFFKNKIRMTNLFVQNPARMPFLFHVSDLIHFGLREDVTALWDIPLFETSEILDFSMQRKTELGTYLGGSVMRMRPEQALPIGFLKTRGRKIELPTPNAMTLENFEFSERFITSNFDVLDWRESGLLFPARMMDSFLETVFTPAELSIVAQTPELAKRRFQRASFRKRYLFLFDRAYLFHLKKAIIFKMPALQVFFTAIKKIQRIVFAKRLQSAEDAKSTLLHLGESTDRKP